MKELTICPSTLQEGYNTYSPIARKALFDGHTVSHIFSEPSPDTETEEANEAVKSIGRISLSGKQTLEIIFAPKSKRDLHQRSQGYLADTLEAFDRAETHV